MSVHLVVGSTMVATGDRAARPLRSLLLDDDRVADCGTFVTPAVEDGDGYVLRPGADATDALGQHVRINGWSLADWRASARSVPLRVLKPRWILESNRFLATGRAEHLTAALMHYCRSGERLDSNADDETRLCILRLINYAERAMHHDSFALIDQIRAPARRCKRRRFQRALDRN